MNKMWAVYNIESTFIRCVKGKGKVVPVLFNTAPRHEGVMGEWRYSFTYS
jgi:hypothetical protein